MSFLRNGKYRFGNTVFSFETPGFTQSDSLCRFAFDGDESDFDIKIVPAGEIFRRERFSRDVNCEYDKESGRLLWERTRQSPRTVTIRADEELLSHLNTYTVTEMADIPGLLLEKKQIVLHSSVIDFRGEAVLFTAPKGTGKSTQAEIWRTHKGAKIINGDRALLYVENGTLFASGIPFSGTSGICENAVLPVKAIVILSQAKENTVSAASGAAVVKALISGGSFARGSAEQTGLFLDAADEIARHGAFYELACRPDTQAADILSGILYGKDTAEES